MIRINQHRIFFRGFAEQPPHFIDVLSVRSWLDYNEVQQVSIAVGQKMVVS